MEANTSEKAKRPFNSTQVDFSHFLTKCCFLNSKRASLYLCSYSPAGWSNWIFCLPSSLLPPPPQIRMWNPKTATSVTHCFEPCFWKYVNFEKEMLASSFDFWYLAFVPIGFSIQKAASMCNNAFMLQSLARSAGKNSAGELARQPLFVEESLSPTPNCLDRVCCHCRFLLPPPQLTQVIIFSNIWCRL